MITSCPRCKESKLEVLSIAGVELDRCAECKGLWMEGDEYNKLIEASRKKPSLSQFSQLTPPEKIQYESYHPLRVACPSCAKSILDPESVRFEFIHRFVVIDRCRYCNGVWMDGSELALLLDYLKKEDWVVSDIAKSQINSITEDHSFWNKSKFLQVLKQLYEFI